MTIAPGTRLGPYEILAPIGAGGMGEVFRAKDTRLDRSVAIKVLPSHLGSDARFRERFDREARAVSALNHPNICTLHDVGHHDGIDYIVMELLEGETLADRLTKGALPLEQVLRFGAQIADGLDKAHRQGIVHRDLKPGNIMITKSGVKLLDFGLAKTFTAASAVSGLTNQPTEQKPLTQEGTILGTFQYMAPEQLEGEEADARTDIFAFGCVLYEMVTGRRAFEGKTRTSLIAAIVFSNPPRIAEFQPSSPAALDHVIRKCLAKDREERWQSAGDVGSELRWISQESGEMALARGSRSGGPIRRWKIASGILAAALCASLIATWFALRREQPVPSVRLSMTVPPHAAFEFFDSVTLSPDGRAVVFVGYGQKSRRSLWVRALSDNEPRQLAATEGARRPFWSPDGRSIGFFTDGKLKRIAVSGGPPQTICASTGARGGTWNRNGVILFSGDEGGPVYRVEANGGAPKPVTKLNANEEAHRWPVFLPDGDHFLFLADAPRAEDHYIKVGSLRTGETKTILQAITQPAYAAPGYLLFVRGGSLLAQPFDVKALKLDGEPAVIAQQLAQDGANHHFEFSVSASGSLTYRSVNPNAHLAWIDRSGLLLERLGEPRRFGIFRLAPDQSRVAFGLQDSDGRGDDLWVMNFSRGSTTRVTYAPGVDRAPVWSPDGSRLAFTSLRGGRPALYLEELNNPESAARVFDSPDGLEAASWSRDGKWLLVDYFKQSEADIWVYSLDAREAKPYIATPYYEGESILSPDGTSLAYVSGVSGQPEIYVEQFPSHAGRRQVSTGRGTQPRWRADGKELFFVGLEHELLSLDMTSETSNPKVLFRLPGNGYDVSADGQRFLIDQPVDELMKTPVTFVSNWLAGIPAAESR